MSFINPQRKEINCKIAYFGLNGAGKSTILHQIYKKTTPNRRGRIVSLSEEDKSLFFDFLPLSLGKVNGLTIRFHLYTVPGHVVYDSPRKIILKGLDGLVFVVDSQMGRLEESLESWKNLKASLKSHEIDFNTLPIALQFNKRDLPHALPMDELKRIFNEQNFPAFETVASAGKNVMECFQTLAKKVLLGLKK